MLDQEGYVRVGVTFKGKVKLSPNDPSLLRDKDAEEMAAKRTEESNAFHARLQAYTVAKRTGRRSESDSLTT